MQNNNENNGPKDPEVARGLEMRHFEVEAPLQFLPAKNFGGGPGAAQVGGGTAAGGRGHFSICLQICIYC